MVAHNPLHGSGHAELPHPALASGNNAKAHPRIRMTDASVRKPPSHVAFHPSPRQVGFLAPALERSPPDPTHCHAKVTDRHGIHRHRIVMHMAENNRTHIGAHLRDGLVHTPMKLGLNLPKLRLPPRAHGLPKHREPSLARLGAAVSKSQEVETLGLTLASALPVFFRTSAELNQARLFAMQLQTKPCQPFLKLAPKPLPILSVLETNDEVISKPHHHHVPSRLLFPPLANPQVQHIVQVDVGQQRTDTSALYRSLLALYEFAILQHSGLEPLLNQPHHAPIRYTMLDKLNQPSVHQGIEERSNVGVEHPVHFSPQDCHRQCIKGLMRTSSRPKSIGESYKVLFVKSTEHFGHRALDNLIFQHQYSERTTLLRLARLADVHPTHRLRSVRSSLKPIGKVQKISLKLLPVLPPCLAVYACCRLSLQPKVGRSQALNVIAMVQERREPLSLIPPCCLTYSLKRARHAGPALCPGHVTLGRFPLGQSPFLHRLLSLRPGLVRRFRKYYGTVRLPVPVHHRCASLDFPMRSVIPSTDRHGISRFPHKVLACMLRVLDRAGPKSVSRLRRLQFCLPTGSRASAPRSGHRLHDGGSISRLHTWPARTPVNASPSPLQTKMHDSESVWVASPSLHETFIHNTLPALTGAPNHERSFHTLRRSRLGVPE